MPEAKTQLSEQVKRVLEGRDIARIRPGSGRTCGGFASLAGVWDGRVRVADDFDELPEDFSEQFGLR